jgi:hypothetical protein
VPDLDEDHAAALVVPWAPSSTSPDHRHRAPGLGAEAVTGYVAKYATNSTEGLGAALNRRIGADELEHLDGLPAHVAELVRAAWELSGRPELEAAATPTRSTRGQKR